jgi:valyl-tRNA synthetase
MKATYPLQPVDEAGTKLLQDSESKMKVLMDVITGIRNVRGEMNISPNQTLQVLIQSEDEKTRTTIDSHQDLIINLARLSSLEIQNTGQRFRSSATAVISNASIFVLLEGIIDFTVEAGRLEKEIKKLTAELITVAKKLNNEGFLSKAPADVIEKVRKKQSLLLEKQQKIQTNLDRIKEMGD